jgi:hypothetical protein
MISNKHLYEEIKSLEKSYDVEKDDYKKAVLKANILQVKLLHNMRTNQVVQMRANDINLISNDKDNDTVHEER